MTQRRPVSPRLTGLRRSLRAGDEAALNAFWREVGEQGAPLVEPIGGDDRHALVTFLWRDAADVRNVVVEGFTVLSPVPRENRLRRVPNTDVWYRTYRLPTDTRFTYAMSVNDPLIPAEQLSPEQARAGLAALQIDPLNKVDSWLDGLTGNRSMVTMPQAPPQPGLTTSSTTPAGSVEGHTMASKHLGNERKVWVYTPAAHQTAGEPYPLLVLLDGQTDGRSGRTPAMLDNLIADGAIPPVVAVMVSSIDLSTRMRELACHAPTVDFLAAELLPWVRDRYHVTTKPAQITVAGLSLGGLAAAFVALERPDCFGNVISHSGSFWWSAQEAEWLTQRVAGQERRPVRFYMEAGLMEDRPPTTRVGPSLLAANRHLRDVLQAKGYDVHYAEFNGGHDTIWSPSVLASGLCTLIGSTS